MLALAHGRQPLAVWRQHVAIPGGGRLGARWLRLRRLLLLLLLARRLAGRQLRRGRRRGGLGCRLLLLLLLLLLLGYGGGALARLRQRRLHAAAAAAQLERCALLARRQARRQAARVRLQVGVRCCRACRACRAHGAGAAELLTGRRHRLAARTEGHFRHHGLAVVRFRARAARHLLAQHDQACAGGERQGEAAVA